MSDITTLKKVIGERIAELQEERRNTPDFDRRIYLDGQLSGFKQCIAMMGE